MTRKLIMVFIILLHSTNAFANIEFQTILSIRDAAKQFVENEISFPPNANVEIIVGQLDSRIKLPACSQKLDTFSLGETTSNRHITVGVRCNDTISWKLYVSVKTKVKLPVLVATGPIPRGQSIDESHVGISIRDIQTLNQGYMTNKSQASGKLAKYAIRSGAVIHDKLLTYPKIIKRGEQVKITAAGNGLSVQMFGTALTDGRLGDRIRVKNLSSKRVIEGEVTAPGIIEVG